MTAAMPCASSNKGKWISFAPKRLRKKKNKIQSTDSLVESSLLCRGRKHFLRTSQVEVFDDSEQTGPLSDDEEEQLDARRPQLLDIEQLSADFGLPILPEEDTGGQIVEEKPKEEQCNDVLQEEEQGCSSQGERDDQSELKEDADEIDCVPLAPASRLEVTTEDDTVTMSPMTSSSSIPLVDTVPQSPPKLDSLRCTIPSCLTSGGSHQSNRKARKRVQFSTIEVQEYARCAGDNPSVTNGVPLAIGWTIVARHYPVPVDDYESCHPRRMNSKQAGATEGLSKLQIGALDRLHILMQWGYSRGELKSLIEKVDLWRAERKETVEKIKCDDFWHRLLLLRGERKKISKIFKRRKSKASESAIMPDPLYEDDSFHNVVDDFELR